MVEMLAMVVHKASIRRTRVSHTIVVTTPNRIRRQEDQLMLHMLMPFILPMAINRHYIILVVKHRIIMHLTIGLEMI